MGTTNSGFNKTKATQLNKDLQSQLAIVKKALQSLHADIVALQKGDDDGPYWNGTNACKWVQDALNNCNKSITVLNTCDDFITLLSAAVEAGKSF